jgi:hypothetical protein
MKFFNNLFKRKKRTLFLSLKIVIGVVMVWRGIWGLLDYYLFPNNPALSYGISTLLGLFIIFVDDKDLEELS